MPDDTTTDRIDRLTDWLNPTNAIRSNFKCRQSFNGPLTMPPPDIWCSDLCSSPQREGTTDGGMGACSGAWNNNLLHKNRRQLNIREIFSVCATGFFIQDTRDYASACVWDWLARNTFCCHKVAFAAFALSPNLWIGICDFPIAVVSLSQYYFQGIFPFFPIVDWKHKNYW